ncbi:MAG: hypothetical protein QW717_07205 [Candidatus Bathyarchaeia archaeon]
MSEEKKKLEINVSFSSSLKFWLAFLVVQIIAMIIAFAVMMAVMGLIYSTMREILPSAITMVTKLTILS